MGFFTGIEKVDATGSKQPYFLPGNYIVRILRAFPKSGRGNKPLFIVETEILESDNEERKPGSNASYIINMQMDMGPVNVKRFVAATQNVPVDDEEITEELCEYVAGPDQPCAGQVMELKCWLTDTKPTPKNPQGGKYTVHDWSYLEGWEEEYGVGDTAA